MAYRVSFTEAASDDIADISSYIALFNEDAARRVCRSLFEACLLISSSPRIGRVTPEYSDPLIRDIAKGKYRIVYLINDIASEVQILRIWHGARGYLPIREKG